MTACKSFGSVIGLGPGIQIVGEKIKTRQVSIDFGKQLCSSILLQAIQCFRQFLCSISIVFLGLQIRAKEQSSWVLLSDQHG